MRCVPVSEVPGRQHLRSARCHQLSVPRVRRNTFGTRASSVAGPTVWNSLPDHLRDPAVDSEQFRRNIRNVNAVYIDDIFKLSNVIRGTTVVLYADDILLIAPSVSVLQELLLACEK